MVFVSSGKVIIDIGKPVNPMYFGEGTSRFSLERDYDWSDWGGGDNRPVNPMHFREGTSCLFLMWDNDWWGLD